MLGKDKPAAKGADKSADKPRAVFKPEPGDVIRINTGIPGTGIPAVRIWYTHEDQDPTRSELDCWAFCETLAGKEPLEGLHFMWDREAMYYLSTNTKVLVVAVHDDWDTGKAPMKDVPFVEVIPNWKGDIGKGPVRESAVGTMAVPLPYLTPPDHRDRRMEILPILKRVTEPHRHRYCVFDQGHHHAEHICAAKFIDAEMEWKDRQRRTAEIERKAREEAQRRAKQ